MDRLWQAGLYVCGSVRYKNRRSKSPGKAAQPGDRNLEHQIVFQ